MYVNWCLWNLTSELAKKVKGHLRQLLQGSLDHFVNHLIQNKQENSTNCETKVADVPDKFSSRQT